MDIAGSGTQPFIMPSDAFERSSVPYRTCIYRFVGEAQVAQTDFINAEMIPAHVVIFDCDMFGVLFLDICLMSLYSRIKEDFTAIHYDDIL
jgi:hypothetical protein